MPSLELQLAQDGRKKAAVFSFPRSGTHFLMNTLELNFGYIARRWWNFDIDTGLNFYAPQALRDYFRQVAGKPVLNVLKSHHPVEFVADFLDEFSAEFHVLYIYRDPRDVMVSFWKHVQNQQWQAGPRVDSPAAFMRAAPQDGMLRYLKRQLPTVLDAWREHAVGWLEAAERFPIITLRYEQLNLEFPDTLADLAARTGLPMPAAPLRPDTGYNVIGSGKGEVGGHGRHFDAGDLAWIREVTGELMDRLGYA